MRPIPILKAGIAVSMLIQAACSQNSVTTASIDNSAADFDRLTNALDDCVLDNAKAAFKKLPDRRAAVDFGFAACDGHARALEFRLARHLPMSFAQQETQRHKDKLRAYLIIALPADDVKTIAVD